MTAKESVLSIYPTAREHAFSYGGQYLWCVRIYHTEGYAEWETTLAEDYTQERVWERAWNIIQSQMLEKLEN